MVTASSTAGTITGSQFTSTAATCGPSTDLAGRVPTPPVSPAAGAPWNTAAYGNFRTNGSLLGYGSVPTAANINLPFGDPNAVGMDEDYDACDLENARPDHRQEVGKRWPRPEPGLRFNPLA